MRSSTRSNHVQSKARRQTRKGGMLKAALAAAALATGAQGAKQALGQGTSYPVGPYGSSIPAPSRNVAGLSVLPQNYTPAYIKNSAYPKGRLFPSNLAHYKGWPQSPNTYVAPTTWRDHMSSVGNVGTRYTSSPEIQTWNPYLRGDPEEVVDYYEGFSAADRKARMNTEGDGGMVKRKNTPMWKAALRHSAKLPEFKDASAYTDPKNANRGKYRVLESDAAWTHWAETGRKLGMNIPLNDPRRSPNPPANWANVPHMGPGWFMNEQLYHHGLTPKNSMTGPRMKGNAALPESNWRNSNLGKKAGPKTEFQESMGNNYRKGPNTGI